MAMEQPQKDTNVVEMVLKMLMESKETNYAIAKATQLTEKTIWNYRKGETRPTKANALILLKYFTEKEASGPAGKYPLSSWDNAAVNDILAMYASAPKSDLLFKEMFNRLMSALERRDEEFAKQTSENIRQGERIDKLITLYEKSLKQ